jgi:putative nucleotidyltransferase with HDIG domain
MTLPAWQAAILARAELYRVGGAIRDAILGMPASADTDFLVRGITPGELESILAAHGRVALVGKAFGVYKFTPAGEPITCDIVFPRQERSTGPGHRDFAFQWDWNLPVQDDLRRRDFTVNAIAERVGTGERIDPFGGEADARAGVLRHIFDAAFEEDPLRVFRGARFAARFSFSIHPDTRRLMAAAASRVAHVSPERVQEELTRTLGQCDRPSIALDLLHDIGALGVWLPELERAVGVTQNQYHPDDVYWHSLKTCDAAPRGNLLVRWAALLHDLGKVDTRQTLRDERGERVVFYGHEDVSARMTFTVLERLRYSRDFIAACRHLVQEHMYRYEAAWKPATLRRFIRRIGIAHLDDLFDLREADCRSRSLDEELVALAQLRARVRDELAAAVSLGIRDLAINGHDVKRLLGIDGGPKVRETLEYLLERVTDDPSLNTREALERMIASARQGGK